MRAFTGTAVGIAPISSPSSSTRFPERDGFAIDSADMSSNMASQTNYTLTGVMTVVAGLLVPVVLLSSGLTTGSSGTVFRPRFGDVKSPMTWLDQKKEAGSGLSRTRGPPGPRGEIGHALRDRASRQARETQRRLARSSRVACNHLDRDGRLLQAVLTTSVRPAGQGDAGAS